MECTWRISTGRTTSWHLPSRVSAELWRHGSKRARVNLARPCKHGKIPAFPVSGRWPHSTYPAHCLPAHTRVFKGITKTSLMGLVWYGMVGVVWDAWLSLFSLTALISLEAWKIYPHHLWSVVSASVSNGAQPLEAISINWGDCQRCRCSGPEPSWDVEVGGPWTHREKSSSCAWPWAIQCASSKLPIFQSHEFPLLPALGCLNSPQG